jgi:hypothetical protein
VPAVNCPLHTTAEIHLLMGSLGSRASHHLVEREWTQQPILRLGAEGKELKLKRLLQRSRVALSQGAPLVVASVMLV